MSFRFPDFSFSGLAHSLVLILVLSAFFSSCRKPPESYTFPTAYQQWAVPLGEAQLGVQEVLEAIEDSSASDGQGLGVEVGDGGVLDLVWSGPLGALAADTSLYLPWWYGAEGFVLDDAMALAIDALSEPISVDLTDTAAWLLEMQWGDARIDEILLASGFLEVAVTATTGENLTIDWGLPGLIAPDDTPWTWAYDAANSLVGQPQTLQLDLSGWRLLPEHDDVPGGVEHAMVLAGAILLSNNSAWSSVAGEGVAVEMSLTNLVFDVAWGDFGSATVALDEDSLKLALFDDRFSVEALDMERAELVLHAVNGFGVPLLFDSTQAYSAVIETGAATDLNFAGSWTVPAAASPWGMPGEASVLIDESNSSLPAMLGPEPRHLVLAVRAGLNPSGPPPLSSPNFITADARLEISAAARLPLKARLHGLTFRDTLALNADIEWPDEVDSLELRIIATNGLPFGAELQLLLLDSTGTALDSLAAEEVPLLAAAPIDAQGLPMAAAVAIVDIPFDAVRAEVLSDVTHIGLRVRARSSQSASGVHAAITETAELKIELGAKFYVHVEL
jgi:hypothetical protein